MKLGWRWGELVQPLGTLLAFLLVWLLLAPLLSLVLTSSLSGVSHALSHPHFASALLLSLETTALSLGLLLVSGTPLAWWLARRRGTLAKLVSLLVSLPIVLPPAVVGVALLQTFGRKGLLGPVLAQLGWQLPFTEGAVILAQLTVSAPFYVQAAAHAFRKLDPDMLLVARTLGCSKTELFFRVALPVSTPGLIVGASLAWARALGEFGATLLFAGNRVGVSQTMPLAIYSALEADVSLAVVFSLALTLAAALVLLLLRFVPGNGNTTVEGWTDF